jgi:epsilon-lactone hydrolase
MTSWQCRLYKPVAQVLRAVLFTPKVPLPTQRKLAQWGSSLVPPARDMKFEPVVIGDVKATWVTPANVRWDPVLLFLHGGGYVLGSLVVYRSFLAKLARITGMRILAVDYRLAPEHPYPAALQDAFCAYRWLLGNGVKAARIVVMGDSAGGGLAAALVMRLRDGQLPIPGAIVCLSPWMDMTFSGESMQAQSAVDVVLSEEWLRKCAQAYLRKKDAKTPGASPLHGNLGRLPPVLIQVGSEEMLLDDSKHFAEKARQAGVEVQLETWSEMVHGWQMVGWMPEAGAALESIHQFIDTCLSRAAP